MVSVIIKSENGLHARPASAFVAKASGYKSEITLEVEGKKANGKSIMNVLGLGIAHGDEVKVIAVGDDSERAEKELSDLLGAAHD